MHHPGHLLARLRFRHLQMLAALDETGGIRRAAQRLNLTQPAISKSLSELEDAFGFALFERTRHGLIATPQGEVVLRGAALLLNEARQLQVEAQAAEANEAAMLRIGTIPFLALSLLPRLLAVLAAQTPLRAIIEEGAAPPLVDRLARGELDAVITPNLPQLQIGKDGGVLAWEALFIERLAIIAAPNHRLARRRKVAWTELAQERWVLPAPDTALGRSLDAAFQRAGLAPPRATIESVFAPTNLQIVAAGPWIGAVPAAVAGDARRAGRIVLLPVEPAVELPQVALGYHRISVDHPRIARLRDAIRTALRPRARPRADGWRLL
jgi:LysR family transcriptional regulator of abg operon